MSRTGLSDIFDVNPLHLTINCNPSQFQALPGLHMAVGALGDIFFVMRKREYCTHIKPDRFIGGRPCGTGETPEHVQTSLSPDIWRVHILLPNCPCILRHVHSSTLVQCPLNIGSKNVVEQSEYAKSSSLQPVWCHFNCTAALPTLTYTLYRNCKALPPGTFSEMCVEMRCRARLPKICCMSVMPFSRKIRQ